MLQGPRKHQVWFPSQLEILHCGDTHWALKVSCKRHKDEIFSPRPLNNGQVCAGSLVSELSGWIVGSRNITVHL